MALNRLQKTTTVSTSDVIPIFSSQDADDRGVSVGNFLDSLGLPGASSEVLTQYSTPLTGSTVKAVPASTGQSVYMLITPVGTIAAHTITLFDSPIDKQELLVASTQTITALTVSGNGKTVLGAPTTLAANGFFRLRYDGVNGTYNRVG